MVLAYPAIDGLGDDDDADNDTLGETPDPEEPDDDDGDTVAIMSGGRTKPTSIIPTAQAAVRRWS